MIFSIFSDYMHAMIIDKNNDNIKSRIALILSILVNLSVLTFFKYNDFLILIYNNISNSNIPQLNLTLPIGILSSIPFKLYLTLNWNN